MNTLPSRRAFLRTCLTAATATAAWKSSTTLWATEPVRRPGPPRFQVSLVGYSLRNYFNSTDPKTRITLFDLVDYCAAQGFAGVELTGYYFPTPLAPDYLVRLKRHAYLRGVTISGTSTGAKLGLPPGPKLDAEMAAVKAWVDAAAVLGAPYVRVFAADAKAMTLPGAVEGAIAAFDECSDYAGTKGVFLGLENDGGILPDTVLQIARGVKSRWFGLNLDLGNYHTVDVYRDVERCAPYAINVHFKALVTEQGQPARPADIGRMLRILRAVNYEGWLALEYEGADDPYQTLPGWLAAVKTGLAQA